MHKMSNLNIEWKAIGRSLELKPIKNFICVLEEGPTTWLARVVWSSPEGLHGPYKRLFNSKIEATQFIEKWLLENEHILLEIDTIQNYLDEFDAMGDHHKKLQTKLTFLINIIATNMRKHFIRHGWRILNLNPN